MPSSPGLLQALKLISLSEIKGKNNKVTGTTKLCHKALHESWSLDKVTTMTANVNESDISMSGKAMDFQRIKFRWNQL